MARALRLDEELTEGVALVHDFGPHALRPYRRGCAARGASALGGFDHNAQSLRIVTKLERRYAEFDGLNLTWESLEGLVKHNGPLTRPDGSPVKASVPQPIIDYCALHDLEIASFASLEAQVAAIAMTLPTTPMTSMTACARAIDLRDAGGSAVPGGLMAEVRARYPALEPARFTHEVMRRQITRMVEEVIGGSPGPDRRTEAGKRHRCARRLPGDRHLLRSDGETDRQIKKLLFSRIYRHPDIMRIRKGPQRSSPTSSTPTWRSPPAWKAITGWKSSTA